ncbi:TIGR03756 family integrating conjugative element protein [Vibrio ostreicida]|uniref:TIGR03756 family integrating conjugative element protein n=1 Tax=Vibrio ostreicida TaxID=526588 RepID=UPI003B5ADCED
MNRVLVGLLCFCLPLIEPVHSAENQKISSAEIMSGALNFTCIDWKPTGMCIWLRCTITGCSIETSLKVKHFNPDAIVQVYSDLEDAPWDEMEVITEPLNLDQTGGGTTSVRSNSQSGRRNSAKMIVKESSVVGSPSLIPVSEFLGSMEFFCKSPVIPFMPYYVSGLDQFSWKYPYADFLKPGTFVPGMNEVGERNDGEGQNFLATGRFGNVYPRIGAIYQNDDYRAAAVFAQRTADIVTDPFAMHVYHYLGTSANSPGRWEPGKVEEWTSDKGKWRMLSPFQDTQCHIFGEPMTRSSMFGLDDPYKHRRSENGAYMWEFWRPYECCDRKGQKLIKVITF